MSKSKTKYTLTITVEQMKDETGKYWMCYDDCNPSDYETGDSPGEAYGNYMNLRDQQGMPFHVMFNQVEDK